MKLCKFNYRYVPFTFFATISHCYIHFKGKEEKRNVLNRQEPLPKLSMFSLHSLQDVMDARK